MRPSVLRTQYLALRLRHRLALASLAVGGVAALGGPRARRGLAVAALLGGGVFLAKRARAPLDFPVELAAQAWPAYPITSNCLFGLDRALSPSDSTPRGRIRFVDRVPQCHYGATGWQANPAYVAWWALQRFDDYLGSGDQDQLSSFWDQAEWLVRHARPWPAKETSESGHQGLDGPAPAVETGVVWQQSGTTAAPGDQDPSSEGTGDENGPVAWTYDFDWKEGPALLRAPWVSALAQGLAISVLVRAHLLATGQVPALSVQPLAAVPGTPAGSDAAIVTSSRAKAAGPAVPPSRSPALPLSRPHPHTRTPSHAHTPPPYLTLAQRAAQVLALDATRGGVRDCEDGYVYYEEYPAEPFARVLDGFAFALVGLSDLARATGDAAIESHFAAGIRTLAERGQQWDYAGCWSRYGRHAAGPLPLVASPQYNKLNACLLIALGWLGQDARLAELGHRWLPKSSSPAQRALVAATPVITLAFQLTQLLATLRQKLPLSRYLATPLAHHHPVTLTRSQPHTLTPTQGGV